MKRQKIKHFFAFLTLVAITASFVPATALSTQQGRSYPDENAVLCSSELTFAEMDNVKILRSDLNPFGIPVSASKTPTSYKNMKLYVGGMPFGVKFATDGLLIVGFSDIKNGDKTENPCRTAGLKINDVIVSINGKSVSSTEELTDRVAANGKSPLTVEYVRDGKTYKAVITPSYCSEEGKYKAGIFVRDSGAGIGTVTYIVPEDGSFAGLGHGICDGETGKLIPMSRGSVVGVEINGVVKGLSGSPGEVKGYFNSGKTGTLLRNTQCGVYGVFANSPASPISTPVSLGLRNEVKEGNATIYSTLNGTTPRAYEIKISDIKRDATGNKCFTVKVTDPALIEKTGGIIQGMSGSPIIQNGKLVGAVTHVLINDPTTGYGIFIENMLNAAQMPQARAS